MGNTFSSQFQWVSAPTGATAVGANANGSQSSLATTLRNQELLSEVLQMVDRLNAEYPQEAKTEFRRPLTWSSAVLQPAKFTGALYSSAIKTRSAVTSVAQKADGQPLLSVETLATGSGNDERLAVVKVWSFEYLQRALAAADDRRLAELQVVIQANNNPMYNISGVAGQSGLQLVEAVDRLAHEGDDTAAKKEQTQRVTKLLLVLNAFEVQLLQLAVAALQKEASLDVGKAAAELEMLQSFVTRDTARAPLKAIDWESDYVFANGFRAPPWRQVYGELCYIQVQPVDREALYVTASQQGYFRNKGYSADDRGRQHLNYDRADGAETFPTLVALLRKESPHFAAQIDKQSFRVAEKAAAPAGSSPLSGTNAAGAAANLSGAGSDEHAERGAAGQSGPVGGAAGADDDSERQAADDTAAASGAAGAAAGSPGAVKRRTVAQKNGGGRHAGANGPSGPTAPAAAANAPGNGAAGTAGRSKAGAGHKAGSPTRRRAAIEPSVKWRALGSVIAESQKTGAASAGRSAKETATRASAAAAEHEEERHRLSDTETTYSSQESDVATDEESQKKRPDANDVPAEYWQIQKMVKYLRCGNQTATIVAICALRDFDLRNETNQLAIRDVGGLNTLINLLDTEDPKCKIGALKILKDIAQNIQIRAAIADLDGIQPLVALLKDPDQELKCLAAETIGYCAKNMHNRRAVRHYGGIRRLVRLLKYDSGSANAAGDEEVAISGAGALAICSKSRKNKRAIQEAGAIPLLAERLGSRNERLLIPVVGILQECASDEKYRLAIRTSNMIQFLVENLSSQSEQLQTHCATALFKCAEDDETRVLIRKYGGLELLANLLDKTKSKELLVAATGAIWKCAQNAENLAQFNKLNTVKKLVGLMHDQPEEVLVNVVGGIGVSAQSPEGRQAIRECNGITSLVALLTNTNHALLVNVTRAIGACALDTESMAVIDKLDAVRLLWSLLKSSYPRVQASAAWAISPCIEHAKDAGEMVRSFVGGLELIVSLLKSDDVDVLASVCAAIANIAKDEENLAVITDHGVVPMLSKLTTTKHDVLRKHLAEAIARCCPWGNNKVAFGAAGAVAPLVKYLQSTDIDVHRSTARALYQLSTDADNCVTMHEAGVVQLLLNMVGSTDIPLQEAAAGTIAHIRRLALASEKAALA